MVSTAALLFKNQYNWINESRHIEKDAPPMSLTQLSHDKTTNYQESNPGKKLCLWVDPSKSDSNATADQVFF